MPAGALALDAEVEAVEPVGAESFLYCAAAGSRIVVRVRAGRWPSPATGCAWSRRAEKLQGTSAFAPRTPK